MSKIPDAPKKVPMTFRIDPLLQEKLREVAEERETTVSNLVNSAVGQFLGETKETGGFLTKEDIAAILPVIEAIGKPISLNLFLTLIKTQRGT